MTNGKVISFINMKGGVGKTTLTIGIADHLAKNGKDILVIDADPQFNATQALLATYKKNKEYKQNIIDDTQVSLEDLSEDEDNDDDKTFYSEEILAKDKTIFSLFQPQLTMTTVKLPKAEDLIINVTTCLDLLSGDLNLVLANKNSDHSLVKRLRNFIDDNELRKKYDYIFIDCPPTLTIYTDSSLLASDYYIIPNRIDRYSIIGIDSLQQAVNNLIIEERIGLKSLGIVYTMVKKTLNQKQLKIKEDFESRQAVNDVDIFDSISHEVNHIQYGYSGTLPTKYKSSAEDIEAITLEMESKILNIEKYEGDGENE